MKTATRKRVRTSRPAKPAGTTSGNQHRNRPDFIGNAAQTIKLLRLSGDQAAIVRIYAKLNSAVRELAELGDRELNGRSAFDVALELHNEIDGDLSFEVANVLRDPIGRTYYVDVAEADAANESPTDATT